MSIQEFVAGPVHPEVAKELVEDFPEHFSLKGSIDMKPEPHSVVKDAPTESEIKQYMRTMWTVRRPVVQACGHKIDVSSQLNSNCLDCWFAWFTENKTAVEVIDEMVQRFGPETVIRTRGKKFWKFFVKYMAAVEAINNGIETLGKAMAQQVEDEYASYGLVAKEQSNG